MRTKNSIKNIIAVWGGQFVVLILRFISRAVFVHYLNSEYLGVNGLFSNILSMLSLAELGVGTAIIYSLYKPIAENNIEDIQALMNFYQKVYTAIGIFVGVVGSALTPFLSFFIKEMPDIPHLQIIYLLFVWNSAVSYFYTYKVSFVNANQKTYISTICNMLSNILLTILQILILVLTQNFILYTAVQMVTTFLNNFVISKIADHMYPFLKEKCSAKLKPTVFAEIKKNVLAMLLHKIGGIVVYSTDNLVLSKFVGVASVGLYSNYALITNTVNTLIVQVFSSITASVGNLGVEEENEKKRDIFHVAFFVDYWLYSFCSICFFVLFNPFIKLWLGAKYLFAMDIVAAICLNFYLTGMRQATVTFKNAFGIYWQDRYKPIAEAGINFIVSIILVKKVGIVGVLIGTIVSTILADFFVEPYVLYKYGFQSSSVEYFKKYFLYSIVGLVELGLTVMICQFIPGESIVSFVLKVVVCALIPNIVNIVLFYRTKECRTLLDIGTGLLKRKN